MQKCASKTNTYKKYTKTKQDVFFYQRFLGIFQINKFQINFSLSIKIFITIKHAFSYQVNNKNLQQYQ